MTSAAVRWGGRFALSLAAWAAVEGLVWLGGAGDPLASAPGRAAAGVFAGAWLFIAGFALLRLLLGLEWSPLGVARAVVEEAVRMRLAVAFIGLLIFILAALPAMQDAETPLRYRVQTFLSFGLGATATLLSLLTVFLSCASLSNEIQDHRIFTVMSKPIGRGPYLLGKWLGLMLLNALLLAVAGTLVAGFTWQLARETGVDTGDALSVRREVLTARESRAPEPADDLEKRALARLNQLKKDGSPLLVEMREDALYAQLVGQEKKQWLSLAPHGQETYVFDGLGDAKREGREIQVRYLLRASQAPPENTVTIALEINGRTGTLRTKVNDYQLMSVPPEAVDEDGRLTLRFINENRRHPKQTFETTLTFPPGDGLEAMYERGGFAGNFARGLAILWLKLGFLAMFGLAAATFLSFPVAALMTLAVFVVAAASGFLIDALAYFGDNERSETLKSATSAVRWTGLLLAEILGPYSRYAPAPKIVDGRYIPFGDVLGCAASIGLVWTGLSAAVAWLIFRARELARVQV
ncbi:MAG: hypothetical protein KIS92_03445 [Planctomycetota bacterium]|nr:hypothetical protein [Planctomycetota bacterium]